MGLVRRVVILANDVLTEKGHGLCSQSFGEASREHSVSEGTSSQARLSEREREMSK